MTTFDGYGAGEERRQSFVRRPCPPESGCKWCSRTPAEAVSEASRSGDAWPNLHAKLPPFRCGIHQEDYLVGKCGGTLLPPDPHGRVQCSKCLIRWQGHIYPPNGWWELVFRDEFGTPYPEWAIEDNVFAYVGPSRRFA